MKKSILSAASAVMLAGQLLSAPATFASTIDAEGVEYWYNPENAAFSQELDVEIDTACLPYTVEMQYINCAAFKRIDYLEEYGYRFSAVMQLNVDPITLTSINPSRNTFYLYFSGKNKTSNLRNATLDELYVYWVDDDMPSAYSQVYAKEYTEIIRNGAAAESGIHLLIYQPTPDADGHRQLDTRKETRFVIPDGKDNLINNTKNALFYTYVDSYGNLSYGTLNYTPCTSSESYGDGIGVECVSGFRFINSTYSAFFVPTEERSIDKDLPLITPEEVPSDDYFEEGIEPGWPFDFGPDDEWIDNPEPDEWADNPGMGNEWMEDSEPDDTLVDDPVSDEPNPEDDGSHTSDSDDLSDDDAASDMSDDNGATDTIKTDGSSDDGTTTDDSEPSGSDAIADDSNTDDSPSDNFIAGDDPATDEPSSGDAITDNLNTDPISEETPIIESEPGTVAPGVPTSMPINISSDESTDGFGLVDVSPEEPAVDTVSEPITESTSKDSDSTVLRDATILATATDQDSFTSSGPSGNSSISMENIAAANDNRQVAQTFEESENPTIFQDYHASPVTEFLKNNRDSHWAIIMVVVLSVIFLFWWFFPIRRRKKEEEEQE